MRMNEMPASSGYGEPIAKFFRLADQVRSSRRRRRTSVSRRPRSPPSNGEPAGPYLLVATAQGQVLRTPLAPFRTASTKVGRRYVRLAEGDKVVMATVLKPEQRSLFLASANGHVLHFPLEEINILSGVGQGRHRHQAGQGRRCLGGALIRNQNDALVMETSGGKTDGVLRQPRDGQPRRQGLRGGRSARRSSASCRRRLSWSIGTRSRAREAEGEGGGTQRRRQERGGGTEGVV